jgi:membrane protein implicated in regulation of membrane protease activity
MIRLLFAAAIALFALSLPIHMTGLGAALRRCAGVCFVAALLPSLIIGLLFPGAQLSFAEHPFATIVSLSMAVVVAYAAYRVRKRFHDDPAKKPQRLLEKTPIERSRRQQDLFAFLADNQPPQGPQP